MNGFGGSGTIALLVAVIALAVAFFAVSISYVAGCERLLEGRR